VIVTEQFGLIPDSKGVKVRGFNCDKKQGLQVCEKQRISPWDLLEGHKNPAPLSFHWFQAQIYTYSRYWIAVNSLVRAMEGSLDEGDKCRFWELGDSLTLVLF
jgi:hypothetical protein